MLNTYFKTAWRNLQRNKGFSLLNIAGLAVGLAAALVIALWIQDEIKHDKFHTNGARLYQVMANTYWGDVATLNMVPASLNEALKTDLPEITHVATFSEAEALLTVDSVSFKEKGGYTTSDLLKMFSFPLSKGDIETVLSSPENIVITERLAHKYFGTTDAIGKTIKLNDNTPFLVSGVLANLPVVSSLEFDWLIPFEVYEKDNPWLAKWGSFSVHMYAMLEPNATLADVNGKLKHFLKTKTDESNTNELFLQSFGDRYLRARYENGKQAGGRIEYVQLFSVVAIFILLIACINFMNLSTARAVKRAKEVGIRKVVGAGRKPIAIQFMAEAFLLTFTAIGLALIIAWFTLPYFNHLTLKDLHIDFTDPHFLWILLFLFTVTVLLSGSYPALYLSSFKPIVILKTNDVKGGRTITLRKGLVVLQFSLSIILIIGTLVVFKQIQYVKDKNLGIDRGNLLAISAENELYNHLDAFQHELAHLPSVAASTVSTFYPIDIKGTSGDLNWPGKTPGQLGRVSVTAVGYDFLKTLGIPLVAGRDFERGRPDSINYIINETAAKQMGIDNPIGQLVSFWQGTGEIIGVAKDFHLHSLHEEITPLVICLIPTEANQILIRTQPGKTQQAVTEIKRIYAQYESAFPFEYHFMDDLYEAQYKDETVVERLGYVFAALTIFIACLGLFGLATFSAQQRTKEIGIRKVLGATVPGIVGLLSKDFVKLVYLAIVIASPIAWWAMNRWLADFAYRIDIQWWMFAAAGLAAVVIALLTVSWQAIRAALANPVDSLRDE